jgi:hypothetical protein
MPTGGGDAAPADSGADASVRLAGGISSTQLTLTNKLHFVHNLYIYSTRFEIFGAGMSCYYYDLFGSWNVIVEAAFFRCYQRMEKRCRSLLTNSGILSLQIDESMKGIEERRGQRPNS